MITIPIKKLSSAAITPTKGSNGAAGYDLYSTETYELKIGERYAFKTDISMSIPMDIYGRVAPRSGHALKRGIDVMAGVIDPDYIGEILVILINLGQESVTFNTGDKIAQIIFEYYNTATFQETDDLAKTDSSTRLTYTGLCGDLEHLTIETRLISESFECVG